MIMMRGEGWCGSGDPGRFLELDRQYQVFYSIILPILYCDDETTPSLCFCDTVHTTALQDSALEDIRVQECRILPMIMLVSSHLR